MQRFAHSAQRAVTLTELLVVLAILSLLATLAVPVYVQKTEQARRATARFEVRQIADAEDAAVLTHGYYLPMHMLDNIPDDSTDSEPRDDFANDIFNASNKYFIDPFLDPGDQVTNQVNLSEAQNLSSGEQKAIKMVRYWTGPFLNPTRVATDDTRNQQDLSSDIILDPWGRPYLFYSPIGIISNTAIVPDLTGFDSYDSSSRYQIDNGELQTGSGSSDPFDRYAIVSYGSDGINDRTQGSGEIIDDVFFEFGFTPNETAYNIF